jgi:hypothetical protein
LIRNYETELKQQSSVSKHEDLPLPKKFCTASLTGKIMLIPSFDSKGIILQQWLWQKQTANGVYYANKLKN